MNKILIINPFVSQRYLIDQLGKQHDITALFTFGTNDLDDYSKQDAACFPKQLHIPEADLATKANDLKSLAFDYIINGSEESTPVFDMLTNVLTPSRANDPATSSSRVDKLAMQQAMAKAGLAAITTTTVSASHVLAAPSMLAEFRFPVFCKPKQGYGSAGAFKADCAQDVVDGLIRHKDLTDDYVIQSFIAGNEYVVDTFSANGKHYISSIQKYRKTCINGQPMDRYCEVVQDKHTWDKLAEFSVCVLDALDLKNGFAHTEFMVTPAGDIYLVELNNRISGGKGSINISAKHAGMNSQTDLLLQFLQGEEPKSSAPTDETYSASITIYKIGGGIINPINDNGLTTVKDVLWCQPIGKQIQADQSYSLLDAVSYVICSGDYHDVHRDIRLICDRETSGRLI